MNIPSRFSLIDGCLSHILAWRPLNRLPSAEYWGQFALLVSWLGIGSSSETSSTPRGKKTVARSSRRRCPHEMWGDILHMWALEEVLGRWIELCPVGSSYVGYAPYAYLPGTRAHVFVVFSQITSLQLPDRVFCVRKLFEMLKCKGRT